MKSEIQNPFDQKNNDLLIFTFGYDRHIADKAHIHPYSQERNHIWKNSSQVVIDARRQSSAYR